MGRNNSGKGRGRASKSPAPSAILGQTNASASQQNSNSISGGGTGDQEMLDVQLASGMVSTPIGATGGGDGNDLLGGGSGSRGLLASQVEVKPGPKEWGRGWAVVADDAEKPKALFDAVGEVDAEVVEIDGPVFRRTRKGKEQILAQKSTPAQAGSQIPSIKVEGPELDNPAAMSSSGGRAKTVSERAKGSARKTATQASNITAAQHPSTTHSNLENANMDATNANMDQAANSDNAGLTAEQKALADQGIAPKQDAPKLNAKGRQRLNKIAYSKRLNAAKKRLREEMQLSDEDNDLEQREFNYFTDETLETEAEHNARVKVKVAMSDRMNSLLVDDWQNVTKDQKLRSLPAGWTIADILKEYEKVERPKRAKGSSDEKVLDEVLEGIKEYFERAIGRILLYKFEREQYNDVRKNWSSANPDPEISGNSAIETYGVEHLARLLAALPELIAQTNMDAGSIKKMQTELNKLCRFIDEPENIKKHWAERYEAPCQQYIDKASR